MGIDVEKWYCQYGPMVLRRCKKIIGNEEQAEEAMQDVFRQLWQKRESLVEQSASSLLFQMATNTSLNLLRSRRRHPTENIDMIQDILSIGSFGEKSDAHIFVQKIFSLFSDGESTRTMAYLHFVDGLTYQEVAKIVKLSHSGVRKRLDKLKTTSRTLKGDLP